MVIVEIIVIVLVTLLAGFFAMAEFAVVSSRRNRLERLAAKGSRGAPVAIGLTEQPVRFLAAAQVGTTGERFSWNGWDFQVVDTARSKIARLLVERHPAASDKPK